jgi:hypothetical protein
LNGSKQVPARLDLRQKDSGVWVAEIAGDWSGRSDLPDISAASAALTTGTAKVLEFDAAGLVRWDSALMVRILALSDLCAKASIELRDSALPAGLARLLALSRAAPEKRDTVRSAETSSILQTIGVRGVQAWTGPGPAR